MALVIIYNLTAVGLILGTAYAMFSAYRYTQALVHRSLETWGVIIRVVGEDSGDDTPFYPVVVFATPGGRQIEFESPTGTALPKKVGNQVQVIYDPAHPQDAVLKSLLPARAVTYMLGLLAVLFSVGGLLLVNVVNADWPLPLMALMLGAMNGLIPLMSAEASKALLRETPGRVPR